MPIHLIPSESFAAFRTRMFCHFLIDPLGNANVLHTLRVGNDLGMIADAVDNRFCAKFFQFMAGELPALIATSNFVIGCTCQKSMFRTILAPLTNKIGKATMTFIGKRGASAAKEATYGGTLFVRNPFHKSTLQTYLKNPLRNSGNWNPATGEKMMEN